MITLTRLFFFICVGLLSTACITSGEVPAKVLQINSLDSLNDNTGEFKGLEFLADPIPGQLKNRVNIMYMHGIGWTEDRSKEQLANSFIAGLADAYGLDVKENYITSLCGENDYDQREANQDFIYIRNQTPEYLGTIIPNQQLRLDQLACMDPVSYKHLTLPTKA